MNEITMAFFIGQFSCGIISILCATVVNIIYRAVAHVKNNKKSIAGEALKPD